jgi:hypothetical protein
MTMANAPAGPAYPPEARVSAVSWAAVLAGAFVAAAVSLILVALGSGFGLAAVSPWPRAGVSATTFTVTAAIWLIVVQWLAFALGGYLTGRLRTKWTGLHTHEVAFRDTAHGFLTWAVATVIGALVLTSAASALVGGGVRATATVASGAVQGAAGGAAQSAGAANGGQSQTRDYAVDTLFRPSDLAAGNKVSGDDRAETGRILAMGAAKGEVSAADRAYLAQLISARTGVSADDAQKRVNAALTDEKAAADKARQAADQARKAASALAIYTAVSMLIGAFIACAAAALGGQQRDLHP